MRLFVGTARDRLRTVEPFDVPDGDGCIGLRRDGPHLTAVLTLAPGPPSPITLPDGPRTRVPLDDIACAMVRRDAHPLRVDVATRTLTSWGDGPAARAYRGLLGPLAPASHRTVALVVHLDPARFPDAVALRGGGSVGALRTAIWCVHRVIAACAAAGVRTRVLTAAELSADAAWTLDDAAVAARITPDGSEGTAPPLAADGQLIGADDGTPVALRVAGPSIPRVAVAADARTVRQTVVRSMALGVRTHVVTDRPDQWGPLVDAIGDPVLLSHGQAIPQTAQLVVGDTGEAIRARPGLTVLDVHRADPPPTASGCLLHQDPSDSAVLHLVTPGGLRTTVRTVTTPAERELTG
ncbi:hypothetical protein nbrc107696_41530 [Gordonia spumicola]|uniref:Type VII secretion system protein EccE domain-containing protein n=1 Tax=Gordonia spumicola TaxID=589161 RepID=A0A7I9VEF7_9ACTN|nr:type VII secretion protein EccE [Gordonia spumicola]GEE03707.1 hypothetical protein nbrc107696_41530 [Gordonia spumicola]